MAYPNARFLSLAALALCPAAAGFQAYSDPDENIEHQSSELLLQDSSTADIHRIAAGSFMVDEIAHAGGLALVSDVSSPNKYVYHMDQMDHWRAVYKVVDEAALDMGVLRGQGPDGLDVALVLQSGGLKAFVTNAAHDGFELSATLTSWAGVTKIWVCEDSSGNDVVFGLPPLLGTMYRATFNHAAGTFTSGGSFPCPFDVEDLVSMDYDTGNPGVELAMLASTGTLTMHPWAGLSTLATHVPHFSSADAGAISVIRGDGSEQDLLMWRHRVSLNKVHVRAFNARNSSRPFVTNLGSWSVGGIANGDWNNDGKKDMLVATRSTISNGPPRIMVAERTDDSPHAWGTIRFQRSLNEADSIEVDHYGSGSELYPFYTPSQILAFDRDLDGDLDLELLGARASGIQAIRNSAVPSMRPTMEIPPLQTSILQVGGGSQEVTTTVLAQLPAGWATHALQPTHLRVKFWNRTQPSTPWNLQNHYFLDLTLPTASGAEAMSHTFTFPTDWINGSQFAILMHGSLVHLDVNGDVTGELAVGKAIYARDGLNSFEVGVQRSEHLFAAFGTGDNGGGDDSSSGGGRESTSTPPGGGSGGSGTGGG